MKERQLVALSEWLFRRGYSKFHNPDGTATSRVFKLREVDKGELSVDVVSLTNPEIAIGDPAKFNLFKISNYHVNELELATYHDPCPNGSNDAHSVIIGMVMEDDVTPGLLAKKSQRVYDLKL